MQQLQQRSRQLRQAQLQHSQYCSRAARPAQRLDCNRKSVADQPDQPTPVRVTRSASRRASVSVGTQTAVGCSQQDWQLHLSVTDVCCIFLLHFPCSVGVAQTGSRPIDRAVRACPADRMPAAKCVHMSHFRSGIHSCRQTGDDRVRPLFSQSRRAD